MTDLPPGLEHCVFYCRAGFEKECAAEISVRAATLGINGVLKQEADTGFVIFSPYGSQKASELLKKFSFDSLIFARQMFGALSEITGLPPGDRIGPIIAALKAKSIAVGGVMVETADAEASKPILPFCKSFRPHIEKALRSEGILTEGSEAAGLRLHLFFLTSDRVYAGISALDNSSPLNMGIVRLKFPGHAPSRSTLKLEEAMLVFLTRQQRDKQLRPGLRAVDLGAAPGGWTFQLVQRGMKVTAVDNGLMAPTLLASGLVHHIRADGFAYSPAKPVDWMVCDIVEQPARIAGLVGRWMAHGWCRRSIFNLKLPMKKRYEEIDRCSALIWKQLPKTGVQFSLRIKHLYHDREEVTGYVAAL